VALTFGTRIHKLQYSTPAQAILFESARKSHENGSLPTDYTDDTARHGRIQKSTACPQMTQMNTDEQQAAGTVNTFIIFAGRGESKD
jgi:hypothetical protein